MTPDALRSALSAAGLTSLLDHVDALIRPAIHLATRAVDQSALALGVSALGGQPDLPGNALWPAKLGAPLSFVAQIRLEQTHPYDTARLLPAAGLLSFFYDAQQSTYGTDPADRQGFRVVYTPAKSAGPQRMPFPDTLPASARFTPCAVTFSTQMTLAQQPDLEIPGLAWTPDQQQRYDSAVASLPAGQQPTPQDQLLGFPNTLQDDMRLQCQLVSHGIAMENAATDPRTQALTPGASNWQLLLQVDSDPHADIRWGDGGMLYYWIERDALQRASFDNAWAVLQTT